MNELMIVAALRFLAGAGSVTVVLYFLTRFGQKWAWYQKLDSWGKNFVAAFVASLVAVGCWALVKYVPAEIWLQIDEPFGVVVSVVSAVFGFKGLHFLRNKLGPAVNFFIANQKALLALENIEVLPLNPTGEPLPTNVPTPPGDH